MKKFCCTIVALTIAQMCFSVAYGQTNRNWTRAMNSSGVWELDSNWSGTNIPDTDTENANFGVAIPSQKATLNSSPTINNLNMNFTAALTINALNTLTVNGLTMSVSTIDGDGDLIVKGNSTFDTSFMSGGGTTTFEGDLEIASLSGDAFSNNRKVFSEGTTTFLSSDVVSIVSSTWNNSGTMNRDNGDIFLSNSTFNNSGEFAKGTASTVTLDTDGSGKFVNTGTVKVNQGTLTIETYEQSGGQIIVNEFATLNILGAANITGGSIGGEGSIDSNLVEMGANTVVAPGASAGTLTIKGSITMNANSKFELELGGTASGSFDFLNVDNIATINGANVEVKFLPTYTPNLNDTFTFLTATNGASGDFLAPTFAAGGDWAGTIARSGGSYTLTITAVPEPGCLSLLAMGALGCTLVRRRRSA